MISLEEWNGEHPVLSRGYDTGLDRPARHGVILLKIQEI